MEAQCFNHFAAKFQDLQANALARLSVVENRAVKTGV
jgi:hypothetical protein